MGCSLAKRYPTTKNLRIFKVQNVDGEGNERNYGKIEITENDLILYQKGKDPICWPLRMLRRYGFDETLFSFEAGRRCPTGEGIYAFKCTRAEALFNLLQECIQRAGQEETRPSVRGLQESRPTSYVETRHENPQHIYVNNDSNANNHLREYENTDIVPGNHVIRDPSAINLQMTGPPNVTHRIQYVELDLDRPNDDQTDEVNGGCESSQPNYVNVETSARAPQSVSQNSQIAGLCIPQATAAGDTAQSQPKCCNGSANINYTQVDFESDDGIFTNCTSSGGGTSATAASSAVPPVSESQLPKVTTETLSYATIDFCKTKAVTATAVAKPLDDNDGFRKTRHNSTIDDRL